MNNSELTQLLCRETLIFDGAMGTELYRRHVFTNRCFDEICLSDPNLVKEIHRDYLKAGAEIITTNSFGANLQLLKRFGYADKVEAVNKAAASIARQVLDEFSSDGVSRWVAGSIGPFDSSEPLSESNQIEMLLQQANALLAGGADFLIFETLPTVASLEIARKTMKEMPEGTPFVLSMAMQDENFSESKKIDCLASISDADGLPVPGAIGLNCGLGPAVMLDACEQLLKKASLPVIIQPNAGLPRKVDNRQLYLCSPEFLTTYALRYVNLGARAIGGCCGTTPEQICEMALSVKPMARTHSIVELSSASNQKTVDAQPEKPLAERSKWGAKLAAREWCTSLEMTPPKGWNCDKMLSAAKLCKEAGVDVLNIPDGPRAAARLSALVTAITIQQQVGMETVLHVCCRDRNFIGLQGDLLGCAAAGINNLMFITGDPPKLGAYGFSSGVFDTDSIGLAHMQKQLNRGIDLGGFAVNPPTAAVIGVGADPNAIDFEREIRRLREKVAAGANYVATQPIFDIPVLERFLEAIADLDIPVVAGIWPMVNLKNAMFMKTEVPGVVVPDFIITRLSKWETKEDQLKEGIAIAQESIEAVRGKVCGIQVSVPLGNIHAALTTIGAE